MKLKDIMSKDVQCVAPDASLGAVAIRMRELDVGSLPVCADGRLTGMITDRDIVIRGLANGHGEATMVANVMTPGVVWCFEDDKVDEAAKLMQDRQIRRLPVLNQDKKLVGIVSLGDLAVRTHNDKMSGETLEHVSAK